jgi:aminoglycoside phosphotransferase (APT) family kinase protein
MNDNDIAELTRSLGLPASSIWTEINSRRGKSVWRVDCPDGSFAARILRPGKDESAEHEQDIMAMARGAGLPVAAVRAVSKLQTRPVLLIEWTAGRALTDEIHARPWTARRLGEFFGEQQAILHRAEIVQSPTRDWVDFFGTVDPAMRVRLERTQTRSSLIHLDYYPANLVFKAGAISGILDWTNAHFGDPRADLARTWTLLRLVFRSGRRHPVRRLADDLFARGWWRGYVRSAGPQDEMPLFLAWAVAGLLRAKIREEAATGDRCERIALARLAQRFRYQADLPQIEVEALLEQP